MANCPKCGVKLKITDWRPNCPKCGVNLVYYGMEERLLADADKAESEHAVFQKRVDRMKASFTGSKLTIARIVLSILPIGALFLPLAKVNLLAPFFEKKTDVNVLALVDVLPKMDFDGVLKLAGSSVMKGAVIPLLIAIVCVALAAVLILVNLITLMLSCSPHGKGRNITINSLQVLLCAGATVAFMQSSGNFAALLPGTFSGGISFGAYVLIGCMAALLLINIVIAKVGVPITYKDTFVNGIPSEVYFEAVKNGEDINALREKYAPAEEEAEAVEAAAVTE